MKNPTPDAEIVSLAIKYSAMRDLLALLVNSKNDREAGRKALLLAFIFDAELIGEQKELARRMGVTPGRCSQMLKSFRRNYQSKLPAKLTLAKL